MELVTRGFDFVTRGFELVTHELELLTRGFEFVTRVLLFHYWNNWKQNKRGALGMLLGTWGASLLGNMLLGKGILRAGYGNKKGKTLRADY